MSEHQQVAVQPAPGERRVNDDKIIAPSQRIDQTAGGAWLVFDLVDQVLLAGQHVKAIRDRLRRAFDEQLVDALRGLECDSQTGAGFCVQQQGAAARYRSASTSTV